MRPLLFAALCLVCGLRPFAATAPAGIVAPQPLYRDPVHDSAADPAIVWNASAQRWWMFYSPGRVGVPGNPIGLAESSDGAAWTPAGQPDITVPDTLGGAAATAGAPEIVGGPGGTHHLFLAVRPGGSANANEAGARIAHFTSPDLRRWTFVAALALASDRVGDPAVSPLPGGGWRMWYADERDNRTLHFADSRDLKTWAQRGRAPMPDARGGSPSVFTWRGRHWLLLDTDRGVAVFRSLDLERWTRQPAPLFAASTGIGQPGVVVNGGRAYCFHAARADAGRRAIEVVELFENDGWLTGDPNSPTHVALRSPEARRGPPAAALTDRDPADAARLAAHGSRDIRVHDPSTIVESGGEYWVFYTGRGVPSWRSKDLRTWTAGPPVFHEAPGWVATAVPENRNAQFWAPDIIRLGDRFLLYYSVSSFGKKTSAIALVTNRTLDPADPAFAWRDEGVVVRSGPDTNFNAIDPALFRDDDGRLWMTFGSYWTGLKLAELEPTTGKLKRPEEAPHALAHSRSIEAVFLHRRGKYYYLFANYGYCCRGVNSTYHIRVGRSETITGPYRDRDGRAMLDDGGTLVLESDGPFIGPGHAAILRADAREWISCHFYDATRNGQSTLALRPLTWDAAGWPVVGKLETTP